MNLELNLVKIESIYSQAARILARNRSLVANDTEAMSAIIKFIVDNIDYINSAISDKSLVSKLQNLKSLSIDELQGLRYTLAESGIDIRYWATSDLESNIDGIPDNIIEYNVIDKSNYSSNFVPFCTKLMFNQESSDISELYSKINEVFNLFGGTLFADRVNPISSDIQVIREQEKVLGTAPTSVTMHINSILEFLGKDIYAVMN